MCAVVPTVIRPTSQAELATRTAAKANRACIGERIPSGPAVVDQVVTRVVTVARAQDSWASHARATVRQRPARVNLRLGGRAMVQSRAMPRMSLLLVLGAAALACDAAPGALHHRRDPGALVVAQAVDVTGLDLARVVDNESI